MCFWRREVSLSCCLSSARYCEFFEATPVIGLIFTHYAKLAGYSNSGVSLNPSIQHWDYRYDYHA